MKINIPNSDVIYRCIGDDFDRGVLSCGYMRKPTSTSSQYHFSINYYSCFLILQGHGYYINDQGDKIYLQAGDFVQRLPKVSHSTEIIPDGEWLEFYMSFGNLTYDYLCNLGLLSVQSPVIKSAITLSAEVCKSFSLLLSQLKNADDRNLPVILLELQKVVLSLHANSFYKKDYYDTPLKKAHYILSSNIEKDINLQEVAKQINMGYENFRKSFKTVYGDTPAHFRTDQKIKHAKLMLLSGLSIKETSFLTGYCDVYSFSKQFTKTVGMPPGRFVKKEVQ